MLHIQPFPNDICGRVEYLPEPAPVYTISWPRETYLTFGPQLHCEVNGTPTFSSGKPLSHPGTATDLKMNHFSNDWQSTPNSYVNSRHGFLEPGLGITASESPIGRHATQDFQSLYQVSNGEISHPMPASTHQLAPPFQGSWTFNQHPTPPSEEYIEGRAQAPTPHGSFTGVHDMGPPTYPGQPLRAFSSSDIRNAQTHINAEGNENATKLAPSPLSGQRLMTYSPSSWTETPSALSKWNSHYTSPAPSVTQIPDLTFTPAATPISDASPLHMQAHRPLQTVVAGSPRERPHMRQSYSQDSYSTRQHQYKRRTMSAEHFWAVEQPNLASPHNSFHSPRIVELPPVAGPPSTLVAERQAQSAPSRVSRPGPVRQSRSALGIQRSRYKPYLPPQEDLHNTDERQRPVQQEPAFEGDLYTPRWKRRNKEGRWEGWCDMCPKGRWLDLKNSRYWEDKMRNHGICARTKRPFPDPLQTRWVTGSGEDIKVVAPPEPGQPNPELEPRKRQAQCGSCLKWVDMDGQRTRARDRAVGWWMHAYRCSKQEVLSGQRSAAFRGEDAAK